MPTEQQQYDQLEAERKYKEAKQANALYNQYIKQGMNRTAAAIKAYGNAEQRTAYASLTGNMANNFKAPVQAGGPPALPPWGKVEHPVPPVVVPKTVTQMDEQTNKRPSGYVSPVLTPVQVPNNKPSYNSNSNMAILKKIEEEETAKVLKNKQQSFPMFTPLPSNPVPAKKDLYSDYNTSYEYVPPTIPEGTNTGMWTGGHYPGKWIVHTPNNKPVVGATAPSAIVPANTVVSASVSPSTVPAVSSTKPTVDLSGTVGYNPATGTTAIAEGATQAGTDNTAANAESARLTAAANASAVSPQIISANGPAMNVLPFKEGGYTTAEMLAANQGNVGYYKTGFDYANLSSQDRPGYVEGAIGKTGHYFAGYYLGNNGNWYPLDQRKIAEYAKQQQAAYNGGGSSGGSTSSTHGTYNVEGAPNWWNGITISGNTPEIQYANELNASIPFLSPEDQRAAASYLASNFSEFADYRNIAYTAPPPELSSAIREQYTTRDRGTQYLNALNQMRIAAGLNEEDMGVGYHTLKRIGDIITQFGGGSVGTDNRMTSLQVQQLRAAIDPVRNQAQSQVPQYVPLIDYLYRPYFSAGDLYNDIEASNGVNYPTPNTSLY